VIDRQSEDRPTEEKQTKDSRDIDKKRQIGRQTDRPTLKVVAATGVGSGVVVGGIVTVKTNE